MRLICWHQAKTSSVSGSSGLESPHTVKSEVRCGSKADLISRLRDVAERQKRTLATCLATGMLRHARLGIALRKAGKSKVEASKSDGLDQAWNDDHQPIMLVGEQL